jgi:catechol 2,3-dioxygenase-like lactoylglutathione lyase family enzyme
MNRPDILPPGSSDLTFGYAHLAFAVGNKQKVLELTERLRNDGYVVIGEPRTTGDGYFESVIQDPAGNLVEITI